MIFKQWVAVLAIALFAGTTGAKAEDALPEIARDMPKNFGAADELFNARLAEHFPEPMQADAFKAKMLELGFEQDVFVPTEYQIVVTNGDCFRHWLVRTTLEGDMASVGLGIYNAMCTGN